MWRDIAKHIALKSLILEKKDLEIESMLRSEDTELLYHSLNAIAELKAKIKKVIRDIEEYN